METPFIEQNPLFSSKSIEIINEGKKYICKFEIIEELLYINLFLEKKLKYKGNIFLEKIQSQIKAFFDYNINEIFEEISQLNSNNFSIIKEDNKYKLKIEFIILRKKKSILINLNENKSDDEIMNDIISNFENIIKEKDNIILDLKERIKKLEEKLNDKNNFNNSKNPIDKLNNHKNSVYCLTLLNDGRLVSGSSDKKIIIYNRITYQPDLIIKEHNGIIFCLIQLKSGILASSSGDQTIKLFNIKGNNYELLQTLDFHKDNVYKIIEPNNKSLISCSKDKSIIFYKLNSKYKKDYKISINGSCSSIIQTKGNEICYSENNKSTFKIYFYDLNEKKNNSSLNIKCSNSFCRTFNMITKDLLIIGGENKIFIINVNQYRIVRVIEVLKSIINGFCMLNENMFLTGDDNGIIRQWKIERDNIFLISKKEKAHDNSICALINLGNGHIASCSYDNSIKIIKIW